MSIVQSALVIMILIKSFPFLMPKRKRVSRPPTLVQRIKKELRQKQKEAKKKLREAERDLRQLTKKRN